MRALRSAITWIGPAVVLTAAIATAQRQAPPAAYDLVVVNGRVVDGTGAPARRADIAVKDGRIVRVGTFEGTGTERIDAAGLVVTPGFIDVHTHADNIADHPLAENFIRMGVTLIVAGNCGSSALSIDEALTRIRETGIAVNFATLIGHNTLRASVMGREDRYSTLGELNRMKALVFKGIADGAVGFSTGLQYVPGTYARNNEIVELARVAANQGGIYATHMRNEGTRLEEAVAESIRVARLVGGLRVQISHLKVDSPSRWGGSAAALKLIDEAIGRGLKIGADQYAYSAGSSSLDIRFPAWALEGGDARVRQRLDDPATWSRIKAEMQQLLAERGFTDLAWATVATYRPDPSLNGLSMKDVAEKLLGDASAEAQIDAARLLMRNGGATMVYHFMSEDDIARIMKHPLVSFASDSGVIAAGAGVPHPRGYGNTARVLGVYVRERKILSLEEAVRKMTSLPAAQFAFAGRGVIREGAAADLVVLDPARVRDTATYEAPHSYPEGIPHVVVNGVPVVRDGKVTGERAGQVIRGGSEVPGAAPGVPVPNPGAASANPRTPEPQNPGTTSALRQGAIVTIAFRAASEDDASAGRVTLALVPGRIARASVWEHACAVRSRPDAENPGTDADQFWSFRAELDMTRMLVTTVRLRYRVATAGGQGPELERVLAVNGRDTLSLDALSARRDCRYDRVLLTITARPAAARGAPTGPHLVLLTNIVTTTNIPFMARVSRPAVPRRAPDAPVPARAFTAPKRSARTVAQMHTLIALVEAAGQLERDAVALLKTADLSPAQFNVLRILRGAGPEGATCGQVGDRLIRHDPDVTRLLDRLERRGLIARGRDTADRRIVRTRITRKGLDLVGGLDAPVDALHERQFGHLNERQLSDLRDLAETLRTRQPG